VNAAEQATDLLAAQECESLAACVAREQPPASYADIVAKLKGHADRLPEGRRAFWTEQAKALGVTLYPPAPALEPAKKAGKSSKIE
jgi:hypothetical protein